MKKTIANEIKRLGVILFGIVICAFSVEAFGIPYNILVGGSTGAGRVMHHFTSLTVAQCVMIINTSLLLLAFIVLGKRYAVTILLGSFAFPVYSDRKSVV